MELDEQHGLNKFTSLKALFKSTDPTKHFHGNKVDKFTSAKDQPELSPGELISTSDSKNKPKEPPKSFKEQLLLVYNCSTINELRKVTNLDTAKQLQNGLKVGSKVVGGYRGSGEKIKKITKELERKEAELTGNDSEHSINTLSRDVIINRRSNKPTTPKIVKPSVASTTNSSQKNSSAVKPSVASTNKYSNIKTGTFFNHNMNQNQLKNKLISNYHQKYNKG
jgi:hypothetical protein